MNLICLTSPSPTISLLLIGSGRAGLRSCHVHDTVSPACWGLRKSELVEQQKHAFCRVSAFVVFIIRYNSSSSQFMQLQQCGLHESCFASSLDTSLLLGWLSHGNQLKRPTLSWNIPTDAEVNTWHWFSVEAERGNQSFTSSIICLTDTFTVTAQCVSVPLLMCSRCLSVLICALSVVFSHPQSGENRSPQRWPPAGKSLIWLQSSDQLSTLEWFASVTRSSYTDQLLSHLNQISLFHKTPWSIYIYSMLN